VLRKRGGASGHRGGTLRQGGDSAKISDGVDAGSLPHRAPPHGSGRPASIRNRRARCHQPERNLRASPTRLAGLVQGEWAIKSLHWLRDTLHREDESIVRTGSGPWTIAALRNLTTGALRLGQTRRHYRSYSPGQSVHGLAFRGFRANFMILKRLYRGEVS
jgi:hypothetical protein